MNYQEQRQNEYLKAIGYSRQIKNSWKISPYSSAYKKRKIRQKVEAVMGSVESVWLCLEKGETLRDVVAQSCLFQPKKTFNGINVQELIWHVFSEVANELGVRKAFCELVPEELWNQRVKWCLCQIGCCFFVSWNQQYLTIPGRWS